MNTGSIDRPSPVLYSRWSAGCLLAAIGRPHSSSQIRTHVGMGSDRTPWAQILQRCRMRAPVYALCGARTAFDRNRCLLEITFLCARGSSANGISTAMGHLLWPLGLAVMSGVTFGSSFCHVCSAPPHPQHQIPLCLAPGWCPGLPTTSEVGGVRFPIGSAFGHIVYELLLTFEGALSTLEPCNHTALTP